MSLRGAAAALAAVALLAAASQHPAPTIDRAEIFLIPVGGGSQGFIVTRDGATRGFLSLPGQPAHYARGRLDSLARDSLIRLLDRVRDSLPAAGSGDRSSGFIRLELDLSNGVGWVNAWPDTAAIQYPPVRSLVRFMYEHRLGGW